jgi:glycylpeptide N-tetradecanoyltransferase
LPRKDVIYTYVVEVIDSVKKVPIITDFVSFYSLPSTIIKNPKHNTLRVKIIINIFKKNIYIYLIILSFNKAAYSYYNVSSVTPLVNLMQDALILAKNEGFDVFNALDIMDNRTFLQV